MAETPETILVAEATETRQQATPTSSLATPNTTPILTASFSAPSILPQNHSVSIRLTETNYLVWQQQIIATVRGYRLESFLTGATIPPSETILDPQTQQLEQNPEYLAWNRQDQMLSAWIQSSLSESIMILVVGLSSSYEIWNTLQENFASQSRAKLMQYKLQLQTLKNDSLSMREYLNKIKTCSDLLASAGYRLSEDDQVLHILAGLGSEYDSVMVSITSRTEPWTVRDVHSLLLSFESRLESAKGIVTNTEGSQPSANFAQAGGQKNGNYGRGSGYQGNNNNHNPGFRGGGGKAIKEEVEDKLVVEERSLSVRCVALLVTQLIDAGTGSSLTSFQDNSSSKDHHKASNKDFNKILSSFFSRIQLSMLLIFLDNTLTLLDNTPTLLLSKALTASGILILEPRTMFQMTSPTSPQLLSIMEVRNYKWEMVLRLILLILEMVVFLLSLLLTPNLLS